MKTFTDLGIQENISQALQELGLNTPTEIQEKTIPLLLAEPTDLVAQAQTGTGKTAAFGLPLLQKLKPETKQVQALVLAPTRELCQQIAKQLFKFTKYGPKLFTEAVYGGEPIGRQMKALLRPTQIVVATPGRLLDLLERKAISLSNVEVVVLDEADEMLSMGFKTELDKIMEKVNPRHTTWLFSATLSSQVQDVIRKHLKKQPISIQVEKKNIVNKDIKHRYLLCEEPQKLNKLLEFLQTQDGKRGLVFCKTKKQARILAKQLNTHQCPAGALHGDLQQSERDTMMRAFVNRKEFPTLISTDVAARGIHIDELAFVVHYNLPDQLEYYTHRSGRTARAGKKGLSLALVSPDELNELQKISEALQISVKEVTL